jgi:hypothetical protein
MDTLGIFFKSRILCYFEVNYQTQFRAPQKKTIAQAGKVTTESYHPVFLASSLQYFHHRLLSIEGSTLHQQILDEDLMR